MRQRVFILGTVAAAMVVVFLACSQPAPVETEPLPGQFPIPGIGPLPLLKEARRNHWAKRLFRLVYWYGLLPARPIPISPTMSLAGKRVPAAAE